MRVDSQAPPPAIAAISISANSQRTSPRAGSGVGPGGNGVGVSACSFIACAYSAGPLFQTMEIGGVADLFRDPRRRQEAQLQRLFYHTPARHNQRQAQQYVAPILGPQFDQPRKRFAPGDDPHLATGAIRRAACRERVSEYEEK